MTRRLIIIFFVLALITLLPPWLRGLAVGLVLLRLTSHNATVARGLWLRLGQPRPHYITRLALPGLVLDQNETETDIPCSSFSTPVLPQQNQENDTEPGLIETATLLVSRHNLEARHAAQLLAVLRNESGDYLLSANKIRDIIGGADATVKAWVREMRPETQPTPSPQDDRPGWTRNSDGYLVKVR